MELFSVYDKVSKKFGNIVFFDNQDSAVRSMSNQLINDAKNNVLLNPADFQLYKIEGIELNSSSDDVTVHAVTASAKRDGEDLTFRSVLVYDFESIDIEKVRQSFMSDTLKMLETEVEKIKASIARRYNG